jgi:hypothetical protein
MSQRNRGLGPRLRKATQSHAFESLCAGFIGVEFGVAGNYAGGQVEVSAYAVAICGKDQCGKVRHGEGGGEDGEGFDSRRGIEAVSEALRDRPWQIMLTGPGLGAIDAATRQALEQILELFTEVGGLVVQTTAGDISITRDFPSDYTIQVDRLLG